MKIKMVDIKKQFLEVKDEVYNGWSRVFDKMQLMLGENVQSFEKEFSKYIGVRYSIGVNSGTDALLLSLHAILPEGCGVILPSYTFFATPESVVLNNQIPVFVDIEPKSMTIDTEKLEEFLSRCKRDKAGHPVFNGVTIMGIIPVHLFGNPANMDKILKISKEYNLRVIEDAAQAHGAEFNGKKVGSFGDASGFSFYMSKNLSAIGDAGIITTNKADITQRIRKLRIHGQSEKYVHNEIGYNSRLDEIQAVVLRAKLKKLSEWNRKRMMIADKYIRGLKGIGIEIPEKLEKVTQVWHIFWILVENRDRLKEYLRKNGIPSAIHYPIPCHKQKPMKDYPVGTSMEVSDYISKRILCIPIHQHMEEEEAQYVIEKIKYFFR